ncbi:hypothetical protein [Sunxiuqinia sp. sy24]|uniref:hypothetical protein n=1 Tax=Sunxiuqinia sp. sy24 TaxID=3461495 RepID=UPI0040468271
MKTICLIFAFLLLFACAKAQPTAAGLSSDGAADTAGNGLVNDSLAVFKSGSYSLSQYQIKGEETQVLDLKRDKGYYSILQINSPDKTPYESTLTLMNESDSLGVDFLDLYNQNYASEKQFGIRMQKRGKGAFKPFVIDFSDGKEKIKIFQATNNQLSTFYGKLAVEGNFLSVQGKGSGYSFSALELKSDEPIPKLWQISHKQDVPHALSFSYYDGNRWQFPFMISDKGNTLVGSIDDSENARLQVRGASYFDGDMTLEKANLSLLGGESGILFNTDRSIRGRIQNSQKGNFLALENALAGSALKLYDSGQVVLSGHNALVVDSKQDVSFIRFQGKSPASGFVGFDRKTGNLLIGNNTTQNAENDVVSILVSGKTGDVFIGADRSQKKDRAAGKLHASDVLVDSSLFLEGKFAKEIKELRKVAISDEKELSLVLMNRLLLEKIESLTRQLNSMEQRLQELER